MAGALEIIEIERNDAAPVKARITIESGTTVPVAWATVRERLEVHGLRRTRQRRYESERYQRAYRHPAGNTNYGRYDGLHRISRKRQLVARTIANVSGTPETAPAVLRAEIVPHSVRGIIRSLRHICEQKRVFRAHPLQYRG